MATSEQRDPDGPSTPSSGPLPDKAGSRPPALLIVIIGVALEILALVVGAVLVLIEMVTGGSRSLGVSLFLVIFGLGLAALLAASCRALLRGRRWARSPVATWQLLQIVVAVSWLQFTVTFWGFVVLALAVVVLVALMLPPVVAATTRDAARPTDPA